MAKTSANRNPLLKWVWCGSATLTLVVLPGVVFISGVQLHLSSHTVQFACKSIQPGGNESLFFHEIWDGPTGDFTGGNIYGVRVWKWCLRLDIITDPIGAANRGLPTSVEGLTAAMDSKNYWRRFCALHRLAELGQAATPAIPALLKRLSLADGEAQETLATICKAAPATAVPLLTNALMSGDATTRCHIVEILSDIGPPASGAAAAVTAHLGDPDEKVVLGCAFALSQIGGPVASAVPVLRGLLNSTNAELRAGSVAVLKEFGADARAVTPEIIRLLDDPDINVHAMAARTLAGVRRAGGQNADDVPKITLTRLDSLGQGDDISAQWAIDALSTMGTNGAQILVGIYDSADPPRRHQVAEAFIRLGPQAVVALPILMADLSGEDLGRAHQSARVIGAMGQSARNALPSLTSALQHDNALVRVQAARSIWEIDHRPDAVLPVLLAELKRESLGNGRRFAAEALGEMGPAATEAVSVLKLLLGDPRSDVQKAAAAALKNIEALSESEASVIAR